MKEEILSYLPQDYPWRDRFIYLDTVDSTNNYLKKLAAQGAPEGTLAVADCRSFQSPGGVGIYMSVLLRPNCPPEDIMHLTCGVGVAMCDAVERATGTRPGIKWTNDLVCQKRKISGILTELGMTSQGTVDYAVIGVGINCCQGSEDFPEEIQSTAGSLAMVTGQEISRPKVAAAMMESFAKLRHGTALDIGSDGDLIVRFEDGTVAPVSSGEVSVRGLYGYV